MLVKTSIFLSLERVVKCPHSLSVNPVDPKKYDWNGGDADGDENDNEKERSPTLPKTFYHSSSLRSPQAKSARSISTLLVP